MHFIFMPKGERKATQMERIFRAGDGKRKQIKKKKKAKKGKESKRRRKRKIWMRINSSIYI